MIFEPNLFFYTCNTVTSSMKISTEPQQRSRFSKEEDELLKQLVNSQKQPKWSEIAVHLPNRTSRQCRERYNNYLRPSLKNGPWTKEEDELLLELFNRNGSKWALISQSFDSRSSVNVKNRYSTLINQSTNKNRLISTNSMEFVNENETPKLEENCIDDFNIPECSQNVSFEIEKDNSFDDIFSNFEMNNEMWSSSFIQLPENDLFVF